MATLEELVVRIKADASQLEAGMRQATAATQQAGQKMGGALDGLKGQFAALVPAISLTALAAFGKSAIDLAGHLNDLAGRTGIAASTLSALQPALEASGSGVDEFAAGVNKMNDALGNAAKGDQNAIKSFDQLGLSVAKLKKLTPEEQFYAVVAALGKITDQAKLTEAGINIFGRGFVALQPAIKERGGNLRDYADNVKKVGDALSDDTIKRIDDFGDALHAAGIRAKNGFIEALDVILQVAGKVNEVGANFGAGAPGSLSLARNGIVPKNDYDQQAYLARAKAGGFATDFTRAGEQFGPSRPADDAAGSNAGLLNKTPVQEYLDKQIQQAKLLRESERDAAADQAEFDLRNLVAKDKTIKLSDQQIAQAREQAKLAYDLKNQLIPPDPDNSAFQQYLNNLQDETDALGKSERQLAIRKATTEAQAAAQKDYNDGLRDTQLLDADEKARVEAAAGRQYDLTDALGKTKHAAEEMRDALTDGLTDAILHFDSATKSAEAFAEAIAETIIKSQITAPLAKGITDGLTSDGTTGIFSGIGKMLGFASGGDPPVGVPSIVGEDGPEVFVPRSAGTVIPNDRLGGQSLTINHVWNISPGIQGTVRAELMNAIPSIVAASKGAVLDAARRGGNDSRILGRRS